MHRLLTVSRETVENAKDLQLYKKVAPAQIMQASVQREVNRCSYTCYIHSVPTPPLMQWATFD